MRDPKRKYLPYNPKQGEVLQCNFSGLVPPEMEKARSVIVVSPKGNNYADLCTVVPISTTAPRVVHPWHVKLESDPDPFGTPGVVVWAKCDMVMRVSYARLTGYWRNKPEGRREYFAVTVPEAELKRVKAGILYSLGLGGLIPHIQ